MISASFSFTPGTVNAAALIAAVGAGVAAGAKIIADEAKITVPIDTGALQASIGAQDAVVDGNTATALVTAGESYAPYVEFGTGQRGMESAGAGEGPYSPHWPGMVAQPYMRPALDTRRNDVFEAIAQEVAGALA